MTVGRKVAWAALALAIAVASIAAAPASRVSPAARVAPAGTPDAYEPDDDAAQATTATPVPGGVEQTRTLVRLGPDRFRDTDWIGFSAQAGRGYSVHTRALGPLADTILELYAADATTSLGYNDDDPFGERLASWLSLCPSSDTTYHARVGSFGDGGTSEDYYTLVLTDWGALDAAEPDGTPAQAAPVPLDTTVTGRTLNPPRDPDHAAVDLTAGRKYVALTSQPAAGIDTLLDVFDGEGRSLIARGEDEGADGRESRAYFLAPRTGAHVVRVREARGRGGSAASYQLTVRSLGPSDAYETDDASSVATPLQPGDDQAHELFPMQDEDWFSFDGTSSTRYTVLRTHGLDPGVDTALSVIDDVGNVVARNNDERRGHPAAGAAFLTVPGRSYRAVVFAMDVRDMATPGYRVKYDVAPRRRAAVWRVRVPRLARARRTIAVTARSNARLSLAYLLVHYRGRWRRVAVTRVYSSGYVRFVWRVPARLAGRRYLRIAVPTSARYYGRVSRSYTTYVR